jgi:hypothetical protein
VRGIPGAVRELGRGGAQCGSNFRWVTQNLRFSRPLRLYFEPRSEPRRMVRYGLITGTGRTLRSSGRGSGSSSLLAVVRSVHGVGRSRRGFAAYWRWKSRSPGGRPPISGRLCALGSRVIQEHAEQYANRQCFFKTWIALIRRNAHVTVAEHGDSATSDANAIFGLPRGPSRWCCVPAQTRPE